MYLIYNFKIHIMNNIIDKKHKKMSNRGKPYSPENDELILNLLSKGCVWKEIGQQLGRSSNSVYRHYHEKIKKKKINIF